MITFDELNALTNKDKRKIIDLESYFEEMEIDEEEKEERKEFARRFEDELFVALALLFLFLEFKTETGVETAKRTVERSLLNTINTFTQADSTLTIFASVFADSFIDTAVKYAEKYKLFKESATESDYQNVSYYFSQARARLNAADTANGVFGHIEFVEQKRSGKRYKKWDTIMDGRERRTHNEINGTIIPINEYFHVGAALMRYPHDIECGHIEELANCRCSVEYLAEAEFKAIARDL